MNVERLHLTSRYRLGSATSLIRSGSLIQLDKKTMTVSVLSHIRRPMSSSSALALPHLLLLKTFAKNGSQKFTTIVPVSLA